MGKLQKQAKKGEATIVHQEQVVRYQGPVPPPAIMEQLESIMPGAADRIFTMAEKEQAAAHEHQRSYDANAGALIQTEHRQNTLALIFAFVLCLTFSVCGTLLIINGHEVAGGSLIGTTLLGVTSSFLARWKARQNGK